MGVLTRGQIEVMGFKRLGENVRLSDKASFYNTQNIEIGDHTRIDDFCVLSAGAGGISIGRNVHMAVFSSIIGGGRVELHDFSNVSSRVSIYSSTDDFTGHAMSNPTVAPHFTGVKMAPVTIGKHVIIGSGSVILPGITLHEGSGVGALSLVTKDCEPFGMYAGSPARRIGERSKRMLELEKEFLQSPEGGGLRS